MVIKGYFFVSIFDGPFYTKNKRTRFIAEICVLFNKLVEIVPTICLGFPLSKLNKKHAFFRFPI